MKTLQWLFGPIQNFWDGWKAKDGGFSHRKGHAALIMCCVLYGHYKAFKSPAFHDLFVSILTMDFLFIAFMLGLVTAAEIIKLKSGQPSEIAPENKGESAVV